MHESICLEKPEYIHQEMNVNTRMSDYNEVVTTLNSLFEQLVLEDESIEDGMSYKYMPEVHTWNVKYVNLDGIIHIYVVCYWCAENKEHVLNVRRVRGTNQQVHNGRKLYGVIKQMFADPTSKPISPKVSRISTRPPEIKQPTVLEFKLPKDKQILIWESLTIYKKMATDKYYETRASCIEGICSLLRKSRTSPEMEDTLRNPVCLALLVDTLNILAEDAFDDVRELAGCASKYVPITV
jgi:hypothetical protein